MFNPILTPGADPAPPPQSPDDPIARSPDPDSAPSSLQDATDCYISTPLRSPDDPSLSPAARGIIVMRKRFLPLQEKHHCAIELMVQGRSDADVARRLDVHRVTVTRWRLYNPLFRAALSRRRQEVYATSADRLRSSMHGAVAELRRQLKDDDPRARQRAACAILTLAANRGFAPPDDPLDPAGIIERIARHKKIESHYYDDPHLAQLEEEDYLRALEHLDERQRNFPLAPDPDLAVVAPPPETAT